MKIAINLVGISYGARNRNWKNTIDVIKSNVINCWDDKVQIYITTYENDTTNELIKEYKPTKYLILPFENSDQRLTYIKSLKQLLSEDIDLIISTRFDISFYDKLSNFNINIDKFNVLFKEADGWWENYQITSDNLFIFPKKYLIKVIESIQEFYDTPIRKWPDLHPLYSYMVKKIGAENTNIMFDGMYLSHNNPIYKLIRN